MPALESLGHLLTILGGRAEVTPRAKVLRDGTIGREKTLGMVWGLEPAHTPLALAGRLMRILGAVVQIAVLPMVHTGQNLAQGCTVAFQFVRDDHPRYIG